MQIATAASSCSCPQPSTPANFMLEGQMSAHSQLQSPQMHPVFGEEAAEKQQKAMWNTNIDGLVCLRVYQTVRLLAEC